MVHPDVVSIPGRGSTASPLEGPNREKRRPSMPCPRACTFFPLFPLLTRGTPPITGAARVPPSSFWPFRSIFPSKMRPQIPEVLPATKNSELPRLRALLPWAPAAPRGLPTSYLTPKPKPAGPPGAPERLPWRAKSGNATSHFWHVQAS